MLTEFILVGDARRRERIGASPQRSGHRAAAPEPRHHLCIVERSMAKSWECLPSEVDRSDKIGDGRAALQASEHFHFIGRIFTSEGAMTGSVHVISHPLVQHKFTLMRRRETAPPEFRVLMRDMGTLLLYEATRDLPLHDVQIKNPLVRAPAPTLAGPDICLVPILRAGFAIVVSMLDLIPSAVVAHIGLYRDPKTLEAVEYCFKAPANLAACNTFVIDPMLATGRSAAAAVRRLKNASVSKLTVICLLAAPAGITAFHGEHPDVPVYTASVDWNSTGTPTSCRASATSTIACLERGSRR
jgi:uracil phosphoribosyltransferase